ncbi:MAG: HPr family phosphocarrier protein [Gammaproteobacteria bacterium]
MSKKSVVIVNKLGLHARAAAKFVQLASRYESLIEVEHKGRLVNGKSIMGVMMLAASLGAELVIHAEGVDSEEALAALVGLVEARFGEGE